MSLHFVSMDDPFSGHSVGSDLAFFLTVGNFFTKRGRCFWRFFLNFRFFRLNFRTKSDKEFSWTFIALKWIFYDEKTKGYTMLKRGGVTFRSW